MYRCLLAVAFLVGIVLTSYAESQPKRIVSAGGAITEWIVLLNSEDKLVGVDTTSLYPRQVTKLAKIGYQRQLSAEGVASLQPDILIGSEEMGPANVLRQIAKLGIEVKILSAKPDLVALKSNLLELGLLLDKEATAQQLFTDYQHKLKQLNNSIVKAQQTQAKPKVLLVISLHGGLLAAGKQTTADWLLKQAGGNNVVSFEGYKVLANEALAALNPDIIVVADRKGIANPELLQSVIKVTPAIAMTQAAKEQKVIALDASLLVAGLSPRMPDEAVRLAHFFYRLPQSVATIK